MLQSKWFAHQVHTRTLFICLSSYKDPYALLVGVAAMCECPQVSSDREGIKKKVKYAPLTVSVLMTLSASYLQPCSNSRAV